MGLTPVRVGQLNSYIGRVLKTDPLLSDVSVIGEISNLKHHSSGHIYFSLKDEASKINCFLSARTAAQISCPMEEGMEVIASGYVSVYQRGGYYSLNVLDLETGGKGQLAIRFEQLKQRLAAEGLFDAENKKQLPSFPKTIAVVTSPTGAAVRDILKIITGRNDYVNVLVCPALVQGPSAAADIASAIDWINREHPEVDVIIAGRGGGSTEELWAFNEEVVARSIFRSQIPVISAVGHETDFTIADFVADIRAETPTAAAQMAVPDTAQLRQYMDALQQDMTSALLHRTRVARQRLEAMDPAAFASGIRSRIDYEQMHLDQIAESMHSTLKERISRGEHRIELLREIIETANPFAVLDRGYAMITDPGGKVIRSVDELSAGDSVTLRLRDGSADADIRTCRKETLK